MGAFSVAGLGGGGVIIPFSMIFFDFNTKDAIAISNFGIFTGAISRYIYSLDKKHPEKENAVIIDYNLAILMLPTVMMGSLIGVYFNIMLPSILLSGILTILQLFIGFQSLMKGREMYKKETLKFQQQRLIQQKNQSTEQETLQPLNRNEQQSPNKIENTNTNYDKKVLNFEIEQQVDYPMIDRDQKDSKVSQLELRKLEKILASEKTNFQWEKHILCFMIFILVLCTNLLRGNKNVPSIVGVERCGPIDFIILLSFFIVCGLITVCALKIVRFQQILKIKYNIPIHESEIQFSQINTFKIILISFIGGWVSGALGIGGGGIINPVLISLGTPPSVATSTSMYMIIFSSAGSTATYLINGYINLPYALWVGILGSIGAAGGLALFDKFTKKYNRQSLIVFVLCGVMILTAFIVPIFSGLEIYQKLQRGESIFIFKSLCY
ncbi:UNKNOWN [Stylonychia lemnae]|uniref:Sulfite exporter TauE/SafE n=1 Tax=Stylonychia lemnae TaxID=5949 RepID=A0A078A0R5_STYLE|nr:UNKNOWN [Stylonychia lemnae]|eukprot:CDW75048.1 UNKNOWN [Stylonychia lemnae]